MRLSRLPRARRERAALRAHREEKERGGLGVSSARRGARACGAARAPKGREDPMHWGGFTHPAWGGPRREPR